MMAMVMRVLLLAGLAGASSSPAAASADPATPVPHGPELIAFDGLRELAMTSSRLGMLAQRLDYTLEVGPDGTPTDCALSRKFRSPLVNKQLCEVLMRRSRFHPARDAQGTAVSGSYTGSIRFDMSIKPDR